MSNEKRAPGCSGCLGYKGKSKTQLCGDYNKGRCFFFFFLFFGPVVP